MSVDAKAIDQGFAPLLGDEPRVLILGTLPSVKSLEQQQYYGHPRNAFWWIMAELCGFSDSLPYAQRVECVTDKHIAIWDVIQSCHRPGSLDSRIDQTTLLPNDFDSFLTAQSTIRAVAFNGQAASKLFAKHVVIEGWAGEFITLPSTSPANASVSRDTKLSQWSALKAYL